MDSDKNEQCGGLDGYGSLNSRRASCGRCAVICFTFTFKLIVCVSQSFSFVESICVSIEIAVAKRLDVAKRFKLSVIEPFKLSFKVTIAIGFFEPFGLFVSFGVLIAIDFKFSLYESVCVVVPFGFGLGLAESVVFEEPFAFDLAVCFTESVGKSVELVCFPCPRSVSCREGVRISKLLEIKI